MKVIISLLGVALVVMIIGGIVGAAIAATIEMTGKVSKREYYYRIKNLIDQDMYTMAEDLYKEYREAYPRKKVE